MSGKRHNASLWLADHVLFFVYRWLSWGVGALIMFLSGRADADLFTLALATGAINVLLTLLAQGWVRVARRNPALLSLDVLYMAFLVAGSGGWSSPFVFYAWSSLTLPALLYGWRGGVMAGLFLAFVGPAMLSAGGSPPVQQMRAGAWANLALVIAAPPIFGAVFPTSVELLRRVIARGRRRTGATQPHSLDEQVGREVRADLLRLPAREHDAERGRQGASVEAPIAVPAMAIHAADPNVEDLRRIMFEPLPAEDLDLAAALDMLALRFRQYSGANVRISQLGRTRAIHPIHRDLLIRLARESLLNVQQHAHAASAALTIRYDVASVALMIQDDGVGLLDGTYERPGLHALRAMQYRLAEFEGRLDVFETEGGGVTVRAIMPLE